MISAFAEQLSLSLVGQPEIDEADMDDDFEYQVRHRAYELWVADGRPDGKHQQYWELAEHELKSQRQASHGAEPKQLYPEQPQED